LFQRLNFVTKLPHKFGKFRLHGEQGSTFAPAYNGVVGAQTLCSHSLPLQSASADGHCMLAGEGIGRRVM